MAVNSIVLITNGISFAIQAVLFLMIGAWADYGRWRYTFSPQDHTVLILLIL